MGACTDLFEYLSVNSFKVRPIECYHYTHVSSHWSIPLTLCQTCRLNRRCRRGRRLRRTWTSSVAWRPAIALGQPRWSSHTGSSSCLVSVIFLCYFKLTSRMRSSRKCGWDLAQQWTRCEYDLADLWMRSSRAVDKIADCTSIYEILLSVNAWDLATVDA